MRALRVLCWWLCWCLVGSGVARAESYEVEPEVEGELDLLSLVEDGAISGETLVALLALRRSGVDLAHAPRAVLYGLPGLTYAEVDALLRRRSAAEDVLTEDEERRLAPFLVREQDGRLSGDARLSLAFSASDALAPPLALQARAGGVAGLRAGVLAVMARRRLGAPRWDARRQGLVVEAPGPAAWVPKGHVQWTGARASVLVGTYRLGFAQRLTLDTTSLPTPDGFLPDDGVSPPGSLERRCLVTGAACVSEAPGDEVTPDFRWDEAFRGVVATVRGPVGERSVLSLTGFGSYQARSLAKSAVVERAACSKSGTCRAPEVSVALSGSKAERLLARTLPGVFHEWAGGGHADLSLSPRSRLGVTGWMARPVWSGTGDGLDFAASARYPAGGGYGAVGVDAAWGLGPVDLFFEGARSVDSTPGGGGDFGAVQRTVFTGERRELDLTLRYYGRGFENPYSRAVAGPDLLEGSRARNELGARVRYVHREPRRWRLRGQVDAWTLPADGAREGTAGTTSLRGSGRADWLAWPLFQPSLQVELSASGRLGGEAPCVSEDESSEGDGSCVSVGRYRVTARVKSDVSDAFSVAAQYSHARVDAPEDGPRVDGQAVLDVRLQVEDALKLRGRLAWRDEDLSERTRLRQELRATVDASWAVHDALTARVRYAWVLDLKDAREARVPPDPPRHLFNLELETRF